MKTAVNFDDLPIIQTTLRRGLLVSLKTSIKGNVSYSTRDIEPEHDVDGERNARMAKWETERRVKDAKEQKEAMVCRSKIRSLITTICSQSDFGLLCPEADKQELRKAIAAARKVAEIFNEKATLTTVSVYVITGVVANNDIEAVRAIKSEVRDLLTQMIEGAKSLDKKAIRNACNRLTNVGQMLSPEAQLRVSAAITAARKQARVIAKAGETAAEEIDQRAIRQITEQRTAFLDLDDTAQVRVKNAGAGRAVDFAPEVAKPKAKSVAKGGRAVELRA